MLTPFEILELSETANDVEIKKAYLKKVRQYPPEHASEKFQQVRDAYELIKTEKLRLSHQLFNHEKPDFLQFLAETLKSNGVAKRVDETLFIKALAESLKSQA